MPQPLKVDMAKALTLKIDNRLSYSQIGAIQGVSKQAVHQALQHLMPTEETEVFKNHRADILSELQRKLLLNIDPERLKKAPLGTLALASCQLYDKERLERGQSTANLATIHADIQQLRASVDGIDLDNDEHE